MGKITFAQAAEQIAKRKAKLEAQYEKGDSWSKKALEPQLQKINTKLSQLEQMNEQARVEKFNSGMNRFMKKYGGYLAVQLAHPLYNIYQGLRPIDKTTPIQNPYERESLDNLRNYRFNVNPQLADIDASRAYLRTQARDASGGSGRAYMRYALGAEGMAGRQTAQAYNAKEQAEFAAKQQLSQSLDIFGRQRVQAQNIADESNKAAYAQRSKYMQTGLEDLSMYAQRNIVNRQMAHGDSELGRISQPVYGDKLNAAPQQYSFRQY